MENLTPLAATYDLTGDSQVFASMKVEVLDPSNAVVATATGTTGTKSVSYTVPSGSTGTYTYRVTALSDQASYSLAQSFPVENRRSYTYDEAGLPVSEDTNLQKVTWKLDGLGRVIRATNEDWKGTVSSDTKYGFSGTSDSRITETPVGTSTPSVGYIADADGLLVTKEGSVVKYPYYSAHGDIVQTAGVTGAISDLTPLSYDEFGTPLPHEPRTYGWAGAHQRETSDLTGVLRMGIRLYDPSLGRFLSTDPFEGGSANAFDYAFANPVTNSDYNGAWASWGWSSRHHRSPRRAVVGQIPGSDFLGELLKLCRDTMRGPIWAEAVGKACGAGLGGLNAYRKLKKARGFFGPSTCCWPICFWPFYDHRYCDRRNHLA